MAERNGRVEITAEIDQRLQSALSQMSSSLRSTIEVTNAVNKSTDLTKATMRGLSQALSATSGSTNEYNRAVSDAVKNQAVLASHFGKTKDAITSLNKIMTSSRGTNVTSQDIAVQRAFISQLESQLSIQKDLQKYSNSQSMMAQSNALNSLATKYSYAGNRLSMGLTLPLVGFFRTAFSNYRRLEVETVRTTKLLGDSYIDAAGQVKKLGKELDDLSLKYGVARELVQGLAGDYAELGITDINALAGLTELTAATEKLGNVDITESSNFIKSIYQTINRVKRDEAVKAGRSINFKDPAQEAAFYADSIAQVRGQLALFNLIENKTSLSLQDVAKAFPELTASATSFGLSMTEATALITPMVSAGFQVGASANSVKVSLQRLVNLTEKNKQIVKELQMTQKDFNFEAGIGIETIQKLADGYENLKKTRGDEGALSFFSNLFGVRQGPRMEVAIQNLAQLQHQITQQGTVENQLSTQLQRYIQSRTTNLAPEYANFQIKKFEDLSKIIRLSQSGDKNIATAFSSAREDFGAYLVTEGKRGQDLLGKITTETGRALFAAASGGGKGSQAEATFNAELTKALDTADRRYQTSRESIKQLGREMVPVFDAILKVIVPLLQKFAKFVQGIPVGFKAFVTIGAVVLALLGPIMKIRGAFAQLHSSVLSFKASGGVFKNLKSSIHPISAELLASSDAFLRFKNRLTQVGNQFFFKGTIKELKQMEQLIAAQSSGRATTASRLEKKLKLSKEADYSGLYEETATQLKNVFDKSLNGYLKQYTGIKPDITGTIIDGRLVGEEMGNAFVSVLKNLGFDPTSFTRIKTTTTSTAAGDIVVVAPTTKRVGGDSTPPPDNNGPSGGPSGGSPRGGSPTGGAPSGGAVANGPRNRNLMSGMEQVWGSLQETMDFINNATKSQLQNFANSLNITKVSGFNIKSPKLKVTQLRRALLEAINAPQQALEKAVEGAKTTAEQVKEVINSNAPPAADTTKIKKASTKATENVAETQAEVDTTAVVEQGKKDEKATKETKPKTGKKDSVKKKSVEATTIVAEEQGKVDAKVVEEQAKADAKEVSNGGKRTIKARLKRKPFLKIDKNLEGTIGAFSHLTSTINEMVANAQQVQKITVEEAIAKLNLGIEGSKKLRFNPKDFTALAELMGVILPQAFYQIEEFTNAAGKPLEIQAKSLQNIINAIAEVVPASEMLPELAGKKVLRIEEDLNRAFIALEKQGGTKAFNIGNIVGTLRHTLNEAISMMIPKENLKQGVVIPLEEITYKDLKTGGRRGKSRKLKPDYRTALRDWNMKKAMTEEALTESYGPLDGEVTQGNINVVKALSFGRAKGRGARSLFRRELDLKTTLDSLTEEAYNAHRAKIEKGIAEARSRMETIKTLSNSGFDIETDNLSLDELKQAYKNLEREMREGALNEPIDKVIEKLRGQSEIISKNRNRPGRLTAGAGSEDVIFDLEKMLNDRLKTANEALQYEYGKDPIPENRVKASTRAVFVQIAKDLQYAYMEQLAKFQKEIDRTIPEVSRNLEIAKQNVDTAEGKLSKAKKTSVKSEEGQALFKGRNKKEVVAEIQREVDLLKNRRNILQQEYDILADKNKQNQENIAQLARIRDEQLAILNIKREEAGFPRTTISGPTTKDTSPSGSERARAYWQSILESRAKSLQQGDAKTRTPDAIAAPVVNAVAQVSQEILDAEQVVKTARQRLDDLVGLKTDISMSEPGKPFAANAQARVKEAVKKLKVKATNIDKEIAKQEKALEEAKIALAQVSERSRGGAGGSGAGSVNLGMPMAGDFGDPMSTNLSPRGRRSPLERMTPRNIMSMIPSGGDLTPDLSGVIETLFQQISQAIGAPAEIMAGVLKEIDARSKKVSKIVGMSLDSFDNELVNKLIGQIQGLIGDSDLTIENIYNAILNARNQIYGMVPKEIKGNVISGKATSEQVSGLVDALQKYNVSKEELIKLDARTLRKIAEKMKLEGRVGAKESELAALIHNAIFNLDKETINAIDLVSLMPVVETGAVIRTTAQKAPKKAVQQKVKEEVVKLENTVEEVITSTEAVVQTATRTIEEVNVVLNQRPSGNTPSINNGWRASNDPTSQRTPGPFPPPKQGWGGTDNQNSFVMGVVKVMDASIKAGKVFGSFYLSVMRAGTMMLPFGKTVWKIGSGFVSLTQSAIALYKTSKEAGTGLKGVGKSLKDIAKAKLIGGTYTNSKGEQVQTNGLLGKVAGTAGSIKQAFSGAMGNGIQGLISTATMGMGQFGMVAGNVLQNLTSSLQSIPYVGGPVVGILGAIAGSIYLLVKSSKVWKGSNQEAFNNFKQAWESVKRIFSAIASPFEDFIASLMGGINKGANATDTAKSKLTGFSQFILRLTKSIETFVKDKVVPAIRRSLEIAVYFFNAVKPFIAASARLIAAFFNQITHRQEKMVKKAGETFRNGSQEASAANFRMVDSAIKNVETVSTAWDNFKKAFGKVWDAIVNIVQYYLSILYLRAYMFLNLAMSEILQALVALFFEAGKAAANAFGKGLSNIKIFGLNLLGSSLTGPPGGAPIADSVWSKILGGGEDISNNIFDKQQKSVKDKFNALIKDIENSGDGKKAFDNLLNSLMPEGSGSGLFKSWTNFISKVFKDPSAANAAADAFKQATQDALSNLKQNFFNAALSGLADAVSKIKGEVADILNTQKEEYLQAYDDQIAAIDAMAEAEQRLTATEEYEANKRQRIKDRELQRDNYQKNRALAIYEGRIDDARQLDLEEQKNISDFNKENTDAETARRRDLQGNARDDAKAVITKQKEEASKLFEQAIKDFQDYVDTVGKDGTLTEAQLTAQWNKISKKAQETSKGLYDTFKASFEALPGAISAVAGSSNGLFDIPYDKLISEAKKQFGIGNTNANSILGLTRSMVTGQGTIISDAFGPNGVITQAYSKGSAKLNTYISTKNSGEGPDSLAGIFKKVIKDANESAKQEILKGQTGLGSAFDQLVAKMNKSLEKLALKDIIAQQIQDAITTASTSTIPVPQINRTDANGRSGFGATPGQAGGAGTTPSTTTPSTTPAGTPDSTSMGQWWSRFRLNDKSAWNPWKKFDASKLPMYQNFQVKNPKRWELKFLPKSIAVDPNSVIGSNFGPVRFNGGAIPYAEGGPTVGPMHQGIPAILHGGEYVVRKSAVDKYGTGMLQNINQGTFGKKGGFFTGGRISRKDVSNEDNLNYGSVLNNPDSPFMNSISAWRKDNPGKIARDEKAKAELWKQIKMGGRNLDFFDNVMHYENGYVVNKSTKPTLGKKSDVGWYNVGLQGRGGLSFNPRWIEALVNGKMKPDPRKGQIIEGGLQINPWAAYGGLLYAPFAEQATPYEQMVVYNRKTLLGWQGGMQNGINYPAKPPSDEGWLTHLRNGKISEKLLPTFFGNSQLFEDWNKYNGKRFNNSKLDTVGNQVGGFERILLDNGTFQYYKKIAEGQYTPVSKKDVKKANGYSYIHAFDLRNPQYSAGMFTGGKVSGSGDGYDYENIGVISTGNNLSAFPNPPELSKKFKGSNVWDLLNPIDLSNIGTGEKVDRSSVLEKILNNRYEVAKEIIKRKISTLPINKVSNESYTLDGRKKEFSSIYTYLRNPLNNDNYISSLVLQSSILKDKKFADYYSNILNIAYKKVYPSAEFDSKYLGKKPKSIRNIPESPSSAFVPFMPLGQSTFKKYKDLYDLNTNLPYDNVYGMSKYLGFNNKFKKLNVGFVSEKGGVGNKFNILKNALNNLKTLTGMPYELFNKYLNIPYKILNKNNELELNVVPFGKKYGTNDDFGGDADAWSNFKNRIRYDNDTKNGGYLRSLFEHELGHILGMYHTMSYTAQASPYNILNDKYESIMSYDYDSSGSYGAGDVAYFQALRKAIGYKTPSITNRFNGGVMPYGNGGPTFGPMHQGIPAVLHGGEYVVRKSAVDKYGSGMLQSINQGTFGKKGGYFTGGSVKAYEQGGPIENNGLPLPKPTPQTPNPANGKPPKPYKTWAEYFAANDVTKKVQQPVIPWSKDIEKEFHDYFRYGYVDQKTGVFMPPKGEKASLITGGKNIVGSKNFTKLPAGFRWQEQAYIGGKHTPGYTVGPINGSEATYKGGAPRNKDWNVWNAKAERERLQGKGFFSTFKQIGYNALSMATDTKHSLRRLLTGEVTDTLMNSKSSGADKIRSAMDIINYILLTKGPKAPKQYDFFDDLGLNGVKAPQNSIDLIKDPISGTWHSPFENPLNPVKYEAPFANQLEKAPWPTNPRAIELYRGKIKLINWMVARKGWMGGMDRSFYDERMIAEIYKIGNEKVTFGLPKNIKTKEVGLPTEIRLNDKTIKNISKNPFAITGLDPNTPEGVQAAYDYFVASQAYTESANYGDKIAMNYIEALLYAKTKGDMAAALEYNSWVGLGKRTAKTRMNEWSPKQEIDESLLREQKNLGIQNLNLEDLFVVHETSYKPHFDSKGNPVVRPTEDFETHRPSTAWNSVPEYAEKSGLSIEDWKKKFYKQYPYGTIQGNKFMFDERGFDFYRSQIHTTLNHLVTPNANRPSAKSGYIIISKLTDMLKANPGALSNLYSIDTWWSPLPGKGLVFPDADILEISSDMNMSDAVNRVIRGRLTPEQLAHPEFPGNNRNLIIPGGEYGSGAAWGSLIANMANDLGVTSHFHFDTVTHKMTNVGQGSQLGNSIGSWYELTPNEVARMYSFRDPINGLNKRDVKGKINKSKMAQIGRDLQKIDAMPKRPGTALEKAKTTAMLPFKKPSTVLEKYFKPFTSYDYKFNKKLGKDVSWDDEVDFTYDAHEIYDFGNGDKVVFGDGPSGPLKGLEGIKRLERNPYDITGLSPKTNKGIDAAYDYFFALKEWQRRIFESGGLQQNFVEALLYSASKGNAKSKIQFDLLSSMGKKRYLPRPDRDESISKNNIEARKFANMEDIGTDDLFLTHETPYKPMIGKDGALTLKPASDWNRFPGLTAGAGRIFSIADYAERSGLTIKEAQEEIRNSKHIDTGKPIYHFIDKEKMNYSLLDPRGIYRDTIHFGLNGTVDSHGLRESLESGYIILTKLSDALKANPGSLVGLNPVDTILTPKPGEGLKFPKGTYKIIPINDKAQQNVYNILQHHWNKKYGKDKANKLLLSYPPRIPSGTATTSHAGWRATIALLAEELGVETPMHSNTDQASLATIQDYSTSSPHYLGAKHLTKNDIARLFDRRYPLTGVKNVYNPVDFNRQIVKDKIEKLFKKKPKSVAFNGGIIPYADGGRTFGPENLGIPAILHGGEYVIRKSAVDKYGTSMLQNINQGIYKKAGQYKIGGYVDGINVPSIPKFSTPMAQYAKIAGPNVSTGTMQSESTHNYNFFVDNFIGETEWFNSMMKEYNMKVVPANQKQAGLESRVIRTYNGINRGM